MRLPSSLLAVVTVLCLGASFVACKASVNVDVNGSGDGASSRSGFEDGSVAPASSTATKQTAFIGVTHALSLSPEAAKTPACSCVAATVGDPANAAFKWRGPTPEVGEEATVLAITSTNVPCSDENKGKGASIKGVERLGVDVVVTLEDGRSGIPMAEGAIIPRPLKGGDVVLRPARGGVAYARQAADGALCRLPVH